MIDIHSHIIHGVDDGPANMAESLKMIREAERLGISMIVATPHYQEAVFGLERLEENYKELLYKAKDYEVAISLGYEVFADTEGSALLKNKRRLSLNKSGAILFEFPFNASPKKCIELVLRLRMQRITPIIAHIERNRPFINRFENFVEFIKAGCYIQMDAASIVGVYGSGVKEFSRRLLKMKFVDMVASNAHCASDYMDWYREAFKNVSNWVGKEEAGILFHNSPKSVLDGGYGEEMSNAKILKWEKMV